MLFFSLYALSQDLIVTSNGDSINCKITKIRIGYVYFTFKHKDETRSTLLPESDIIFRQFSYFNKSEVPADKIIDRENFIHLRLSLNGGFSYETGKVDQNQDAAFIDYFKKLKSGYHFGADLTYYFLESIGVGAKYQRFMTSNSLDNIYIEDSFGNRRYGQLADNIKISFYGPSISSRLISANKKNCFLLSYALGYIGYKNNSVLVDEYLITGNTFGMDMDIGYDIGITDKLQVGLQISMFSGYLTSYKLNDGTTTETINLTKGNYESLYRIDFSIGIRFNK